MMLTKALRVRHTARPESKKAKPLTCRGISVPTRGAKSKMMQERSEGINDARLNKSTADARCMQERRDRTDNAFQRSEGTSKVLVGSVSDVVPRRD